LLQGITAGSVFLEDLFDAFRRDTIFTFKVKGADLYRMMEFNIAQEEGNRCQIAGFAFSYRDGGETGKNSIVTSSIDPAKTYLVATTSFLARRMERYLGKDANCTDTGVSIQDGMMKWFEQFKHVGIIEQRIVSIE
jgi:2',3'-cyclic-nucleotide 2'-phosphodiesterase (5'-nucleotidase family)